MVLSCFDRDRAWLPPTRQVDVLVRKVDEEGLGRGRGLRRRGFDDADGFGGENVSIVGAVEVCCRRRNLICPCAV